jgi:hypothetical protein
VVRPATAQFPAAEKERRDYRQGDNIEKIVAENLQLKPVIGI